MSGFGRWLNQPQQGQQGGQLAALAQQLGIDPAVISAAGGQQSQSRLQQLAPLLGALGSGFNAIRAGGTFGQGFEPAAAQMMQGQQQQGGLQGLGQLLEIQQLLDARKGADAERQAMADIQKRLDSGEKFTEAEIVSLAMRFPKAQNIWQEMLKGLKPEGADYKDLDDYMLGTIAQGVPIEGIGLSAEQARAMLEERQQAKIAAASAGRTQINTAGPDGVDPKALAAYQKERFKDINERATGIATGLPAMRDKRTRLKTLVGDLRIARDYIGPGAIKDRAGLRVKMATGLASPEEERIYGAIQLAESGQIQQSMRERISETGAVLMPGSQTEAEGQRLLKTVPGPDATLAQLDQFEQRIDAWYSRVEELARQVQANRNDPISLERIMSGVGDDAGEVRQGNDGRSYRVFGDGTMELVE
jgi:hypothetical protein